MRVDRSSVSDEPIPRSSRRLQVCRIGGVLLDLAPKPIDEDIDRSLLSGAARSRQRLARNDRARVCTKQAQHLALTLRDANRIVSSSQFSALKREREASEANDAGLDAARRRGSGSSKHRTNPQQQFPRLKRFCEIVVDANFEATHPILRFAARR